MENPHSPIYSMIHPGDKLLLSCWPLFSPSSTRMCFRNISYMSFLLFYLVWGKFSPPLFVHHNYPRHNILFKIHTSVNRIEKIHSLQIWTCTFPKYLKSFYNINMKKCWSTCLLNFLTWWCSRNKMITEDKDMFSFWLHLSRDMTMKFHLSPALQVFPMPPPPQSHASRRLHRAEILFISRQLQSGHVTWGKKASRWKIT